MPAFTIWGSEEGRPLACLPSICPKPYLFAKVLCTLEVATDFEARRAYESWDEQWWLHDACRHPLRVNGVCANCRARWDEFQVINNALTRVERRSHRLVHSTETRARGVQILRMPRSDDGYELWFRDGRLERVVTED